MIELIPEEELENMVVERVDFPGDIIEELFELSKEMIEYVKKEKALGLAAPQIGVPKKLAVMRFEGVEGKDSIMPIINPLYFKKGSRIQMREACLSYPDREFGIKRYKSIKARFFVFSENGDVIRPVEMNLYGRDSIVYQHEAMHCEGKTIAQLGKEIIIKEKL